MSIRYPIFIATAIWYAIASVGHQLYGHDMFVNNISVASVELELLGSFKGNYYAGTVWMAIGSYLHYAWASERSQRVHAKRLTAVFTLFWAGLAYFYAGHGAPGIWKVISITAVLEALCFITA